ncbi:MAG: Peptidyl-tRNA hydrolase [Candidatus Omnitrophica bacterium ADurb.Bin277]|nr:MAG: Peptidyl-tRNA hydrolase [Candidatus Omnitrophica bacterium ADurb.Bin277]
MKIIVGLGNPGERYVKTRHNIGRRLIEYIASEEDRKFARKKFLNAHTAEVSWGREIVMVACLESYMNLSGGPVKALTDHFKITGLKDLLIVVDDVALPFGRMRLRGGGSTGGHNGLASVETVLGSSEYPRLRLGIGAPDRENPKISIGVNEPLQDYVLSPFNRDEEKKMDSFLELGAEACRKWATEPFERTVQWVNSTNL